MGVYGFGAEVGGFLDDTAAQLGGRHAGESARVTLGLASEAIEKRGPTQAHRLLAALFPDAPDG